MTKFKITKDIKERIRLIIPLETNVIEVKRVSGTKFKVYAVWHNVRIAEADYTLRAGESFFINDTICKIDFEDD